MNEDVRIVAELEEGKAPPSWLGRGDEILTREILRTYEEDGRDTLAYREGDAERNAVTSRRFQRPAG